MAILGETAPNSGRALQIWPISKHVAKFGWLAFGDSVWTHAGDDENGGVGIKIRYRISSVQKNIGDPYFPFANGLFLYKDIRT